MERALVICYLLEPLLLGELWPLAIFLNICFPLEKMPFFFFDVSSVTRWVPFGVFNFSSDEFETTDDS